MFLKLHFSNGARLSHCFWLADYYINNKATANTTSWTTLTLAANNFAYAGYSAKNSEFINTNSPTNVRSAWGPHRGTAGVNYYGMHRWVLEFQMHDDSAQKYYIQQEHSNTFTDATYREGTYGLIGTSTTAYPNTQWTTTSINTDYATITGNTVPRVFLQSARGTNDYNGVNENQVLGPYTNNGLNNITTFWMYCTNDALVWAASRQSDTVTGYPALSALPNKDYYIGPFVYSQYTRDDAFNYSNNDNLYSVAYYNWYNAQNATAAANGYGGMFHSTSHFANATNPNGTRNSAYDYCPMTMLSTKNMTGGANTFPANNTLIHQRCLINIGNFGMHEGYGLGDNPSHPGNVPATASTSVNRRSYISYSSTYAVQYRVPNKTLTGVGYQLVPFGVYCNTFDIEGGSITERSGLRIFAGNFQPGDVINHEGTTYSLMPFYTSNFSYNIALAVPKE